MQYTKEQYEKAKSVSLIEYLIYKGHEFTKEGNRYRHKTHDSLIVSEDGKWFWNSKGIFGAGAITFLHKSEGMTIPEAVEELNGRDMATVIHEQPSDSPKRTLVLPKRYENLRRAFAYLHITRGIDKDILSSLISEKKIYESIPYHNIVFLGFDEDGDPRHATLYGTYTKSGKKTFKGEVPGSNKSYGFHMVGTQDTVCVFESPIDAMSHATIAKLNHEDYDSVHRIALCSTWDGALERFLKHNQISQIVFCLDSDDAGNTASEKYMQKYGELGYSVQREKPCEKDFNDELLDLIQIEIELGGFEI